MLDKNFVDFLIIKLNEIKLSFMETVVRDTITYIRNKFFHSPVTSLEKVLKILGPATKKVNKYGCLAEVLKGGIRL